LPGSADLRGSGVTLNGAGGKGAIRAGAEARRQGRCDRGVVEGAEILLQAFEPGEVAANLFLREERGEELDRVAQALGLLSYVVELFRVYALEAFPGLEQMFERAAQRAGGVARCGGLEARRLFR
jgi:hypothetical protein